MSTPDAASYSGVSSETPHKKTVPEQFGLETILDRLLTASDLALVITGPERDLLFYNRAALSLLGSADNHLSIDSLPDPPDDTALIIEHSHPSRGILHLRVRSIGLDWFGTQARAFVVVDITEQERLQESLRSRQALFNQTQRMTLTGGWEFDMTSQAMTWTRQMYEIFEQGAEYTPTLNSFLAMFPGESGRKLEEAITGILESAAPWDMELKARTGTGRDIWVRSIARAHTLRGSTVKITGSVQDITRRKRDEEELRSNRERLAAVLRSAQSDRDRMDRILRSIADGLLVFDSSDKLVLCNNAAEEILSIRAGDFLGRSVEWLWAMTGIQRDDRPCRQAINSGAQQFDFELNPGDGAVRNIRSMVTKLPDPETGQCGIVVVLHDMSKLHQIDQMKSEFIATAAHELRTPMTSIQGFSELLITRKNFSEDERLSLLKMIHANAVALSRIITDLLDIARIESGKGFSLDCETTDLQDLLRRKVEAYSLQHPDFRFILDIPDGKESLVHADDSKIMQVMDNLLSNAVKYSDPPSEIRISLAKLKQAWRIAVEDQGVGMNSEQVARIFDRFYRGHAASGEKPGTGLGMSIVRHIVEAHGGDVSVSSTPGKGTLTSFTLPFSGP